MKLLKMDQSPPARAAMMACAALEVEVEMVEKDIIRTTPEIIEEEEIMKRCSIIATPVLQDGECTVMDGFAIVPYLGDKYAKEDSTLYPKDPEKRGLVEERISFDTAALFTRVCIATHPVFVEGKTPTEEDFKEIEETYRYVEEMLSDIKFFAGDDITLADIAAIADISTLNVIAPVDGDKYPKLKTWMEEMQKQPYVQQYNQPGLEIFEKLYKEKLGSQ